MRGVVEARHGPYWLVRHGEGQGDIHYLRPQEFDYRDINIGDKVTLEYRSTARLGLWYASKEHEK